MLQDRRVDRHDVIALLQHRPPPFGLDVVLQQNPVVAEVVRRADAAVDLRGREHEAAPLAQRHDLVHRRHVRPGCHDPAVKHAAELITLLSAGLFAGAALYVSAVEHPARVAAGTTVALAQFPLSYARAAPLQGASAIVSSKVGSAARAAHDRRPRRLRACRRAGSVLVTP
jgi:hypothetical protein